MNILEQLRERDRQARLDKWRTAADVFWLIVTAALGIGLLWMVWAVTP